MTRDTVPIMALGAAMILALLLVAIELRDIKARLDRHRADLIAHGSRLTRLDGAPMPRTRRAPKADPATWADVLPPNHVLPPAGGSWLDSPDPEYDQWTIHDVGTWSSPGDTLTMPSRDTMQLATTTARLRPPTIAPPADVLDALHRSGRAMTRRELAEATGLEPWQVAADLRDLMHAGGVTIAQFTHGTDAAYIPTGAK